MDARDTQEWARLATMYTQIRAAHQRSPLLCAHCRTRPAACVGMYECMTSPEPACGACCAHGCEDGHCEPIGDEEE